jgi:membrane-associated phospholipid phosphatase
MDSIYLKIKELNINAFKFLNQTFGKSHFDQIAIFADKFGGPHIFHYHLLFIAIIASIMLYHKKDRKEDLKELITLGTTAMLTLFVSIVLCLVLIADFLKDIVASERPYCFIDNIYTIKEVVSGTTCNRGFPSGHMTFSVIMITSFWPLLNQFFKTIAALTLTTIALSRISSGVHLPLDIVGAVLITLPITLYIRNKIEKLVRHYEKKWHLFDKLTAITFS